MIVGDPIAMGGGRYKIIITAHAGATVTLTGGGKTYTAVENNGTWTFRVPDAGTYTATATYNGSSTTKTFVVADTSVDLYYVNPTLSENTPATIQKVARDRTGDTYWDIGDMTAEIAFRSVTVYGYLPDQQSGAGLDMSGLTCRAFIIGFDHNSSKEGTGIHFQIGKTSNGTDICFVNHPGNSDAYFCMRTGNINTGGWKSSIMRATICTSFLSALPTAWQSVIAACPKYTDNVGGGGTLLDSVTQTSDKIWLLSEFEVYGTRTNANPYEQNSQVQYAYYAGGHSKVKYVHSATTTAYKWWLRSPYSGHNAYYCSVSDSGATEGAYAYTNMGLAPGFKVA